MTLVGIRIMTLSLTLYQDLLLASLFRNFILAERIFASIGASPVELGLGLGLGLRLGSGLGLGLGLGLELGLGLGLESGLESG